MAIEAPMWLEVRKVEKIACFRVYINIISQPRYSHIKKLQTHGSNAPTAHCSRVFAIFLFCFFPQYTNARACQFERGRYHQECHTQNRQR